MSARDTQVGGDHYKKYKIQPTEYCMANNLNHLQSNVIKYVTRYKDKNGVVDLKKALHSIQWLIEIEETKQKQQQESQQNDAVAIADFNARTSRVLTPPKDWPRSPTVLFGDSHFLGRSTACNTGISPPTEPWG